MNWRERVYQNYVSTHESFAARARDTEALRGQFLVWQKYFGRFLPISKETRILDVGCGGGEFLWWLKELGYKNLSGIDISPEQVEAATKLGLKITLGDFRTVLAGQKNQYEIIFARDLLEHFEPAQILEILDIFHSLLMPEGRLILQTPNAESPFAGRARYYDFTHGISFTPHSLCQALYTAKFKEIRIWETGPVVHGPISLIRAILWKLFSFVWNFYFLVELGAGQGIFTQNMIVSSYK